MKTHGFVVAACLAWSLEAMAVDTAGKTPGDVRYHGDREVLLQGFHWNSVRTKPSSWYVVLKQQAARIAEDGFTAVWMPPPWRDTSSWKDASTGASGGGEGYFWHDFDKNGAYGSDAQLRDAAATLNAKGVELVYDIVANHRRAGVAGEELSIPGGRNRLRSDCAQCDDGDPFMAGDADLNLANPENIEMFRKELTALRETYHASGFRFDFVRGYAGTHVDELMKDADDDGFCVGEYWKGPSEFPQGDPRRAKSWQDLLKAWSDEAHCTVFDFALKERMQNGAVADWRHGLNGNPDPRWREVATTFVDNHDTGYSPGANGGQHHWALANDDLRQLAYAFILTTPGTPTVYWPDMYADDGSSGKLHDEIKTLIALRREAKIVADSPVIFDTAKGGLIAKVGEPTRLVLSLDSPTYDAGPDFRPRFASPNRRARVWTQGVPSMVTKRFECDVPTQPGESVAVVGSASALGVWTPANGVPLAWRDSPAPHWAGSVEMKEGFVEWKCVKRASDGTVQWQAGANNITSPDPAVVESGRL